MQITPLSRLISDAFKEAGLYGIETGERAKEIAPKGSILYTAAELNIAFGKFFLELSKAFDPTDQ